MGWLNWRLATQIVLATKWKQTSVPVRGTEWKSLGAGQDCQTLESERQSKPDHFGEMCVWCLSIHEKKGLNTKSVQISTLLAMDVCFITCHQLFDTTVMAQSYLGDMLSTSVVHGPPLHQYRPLSMAWQLVNPALPVASYRQAFDSGMLAVVADWGSGMSQGQIRKKQGRILVPAVSTRSDMLLMAVQIYGSKIAGLKHV